MTIKTGDLAPNIKSKGANDKADLHTWIGNNWAVISHQSIDHQSAIQEGKAKQIKKQIKFVTIAQTTNNKSITLSVLDGHNTKSEFDDWDNALFDADMVYIVSPEKYIQLIIPYPKTIKADMGDIIAAIDFLNQVKTTINS